MADIERTEIANADFIARIRRTIRWQPLPDVPPGVIYMLNPKHMYTEPPDLPFWIHPCDNCEESDEHECWIDGEMYGPYEVEGINPADDRRSVHPWSD